MRQLSETRAAAERAMRKLELTAARIGDAEGFEILLGTLTSHLGLILYSLAQQNQLEPASDILVRLTILAYNDIGAVLPPPDSPLWECTDPPRVQLVPQSGQPGIALIPLQRDGSEAASLTEADVSDSGDAVVRAFNEMQPTVTAAIREESLAAVIGGLGSILACALQRLVADNRTQAVNGILKTLECIIESASPSGTPVAL